MFYDLRNFIILTFMLLLLQRPEEASGQCHLRPTSRLQFSQEWTAIAKSLWSQTSSYSVILTDACILRACPENVKNEIYKKIGIFLRLIYSKLLTDCLRCGSCLKKLHIAFANRWINSCLGCGKLGVVVTFLSP